METFAFYLLKSTVWLTGFLLIYMLFLRNERFFILNRVYLVFGILASILFPLFTWRYTVVFPVSQTVDVLEPEVLGTIPTATVPEPFPVQGLLLYVYMAGALYLLSRLVKQSLSVWNVIRQSEPYRFNSVKLIRTDRYPASFSFFSFIFVNPSIDEPETSEIVNHEQEHIRQQHWIDLLLFEILRTMHWFNPASWLYGRLIRQNHEYLADERALQRTTNPAIYRAALLNQMFGGPVIPLANSFNYSINKKRFKMMTKTIHSPFRKLKLLLVLPLVAGVFYAFAAPEYQYVQVENESAMAEAAPTGNGIEALLAQVSQNQTNSLQSQPIASVSTTLPTDGKTIKGRVITEDGKPLPGTSIVIKGTTDGTMPDANGYFELKTTVDSPIVFSFVGFQSQEIKPDFEKAMLITMKRAIISIDAVGNLSLGAQTEPGLVIVDGKEIPRTELGKIDPFSIESITVLKNESAIGLYGEKAKDGVILITMKSGQTPDNQNAGAATNIRVVGYATNQSAQQPNGVIAFRGSSMSGAKPLIVVDGEVSENQNVQDINPATIQSVNVLKNEFAVKKYGEKGKDGVVEITLKKGQSPDNQGPVTVSKVQVVGYGKDQSAQQPTGGVVVRSTGTMAGAKPLYVIDGVVSASQNIEDINPATIQSIAVVKNESAIKKYGEKGKDGVVEITLKKGVTSDKTSDAEIKVTGYASQQKEKEVFIIVEQMPEFKGGIEALKAYVASTLKYPAIALENGIGGKVHVQFVVSKTGKVTDVKIAKGVDPSLDKEAIRIVDSMPDWIPGTQRGMAVDVSFTIPINFSLPEAASVKEKSAAAPSAGQNITVESKRLIIVPNPANNQATITAENMTEPLKLDVSVYDKFGKRIKAEQKNGPTFSLSISDLTTGTYLISANDGKVQYVGNLVVVH
jgi:TonB family protein